MAQPVWVLSVDLQTKTATFQSGLADAARTARTSFQDIKGGATEMGGAVGRSSGEARHAVMMLGEEFGIHLPRGVTSFIASLGPVNSAMEMAFPFIAISAGAAVLLEHLRKVREEAEKSAQEEARFGTTVQTVFNGLKEKLLEAEKSADELRGNHLGALKAELKLIDMQSLDDLAGQFDKLSETADKTLQTLKTDWFEFGSGSTGAAHALDDFKTKYLDLLSKQDSTGAANLLSGTLYSARAILADMNTIRSESTALNSGKSQSQFSPAERQAAAQSLNALKAAGVQWTDKELQAQQTLVQLLQGQVATESYINALKTADKGKAKEQTGKDIKADALRQAEAEREGRDQYIRELLETGKEARDVYEKSIRDLIGTTKEGTAERLEAIRQGMHEEEQAGLEETDFYQELGVQQIEVTRQIGEAERQVRDQMTQEAVDQEVRMGELKLAAMRESLTSARSLVLMSGQERAAVAQAISDKEFEIQREGIEKKLAALDKFARDYEVKKKELNDKLLALDQQQENADQQLHDKAAQNNIGHLTAQQAQLVSLFNQGAAEVLTGRESFLKMMQSIDATLASSMIQNALKSMEAEDMTKERDAAAAARKAMLAGWHFPFPANIIAAPVLAAGAFAAVMAFERGTDGVPGSGRGDIVPALLSPGEGVVPGGVMDGLRGVARNGGFDGGSQIHIHARYAPTIHAIDQDGVDKMLTKHGDTFQKHFERALRRTNR